MGTTTAIIMGYIGVALMVGLDVYKRQYLVRVNLVARWSRLDPAHGREMFARLVEALDGRKLIENKQ